MSIILSSKSPMCLFWGEELLFFYNDAYRLLVGNDGKQSATPGTAGSDAFPETWHIVSPLIDQIMAGGEPVLADGNFAPFPDNSIAASAGWTFSLSGVEDESGKTGGVLVTCTETPKAVAGDYKAGDELSELEYIIKATDLGIWDLNPATGKFSANSRVKSWFGLSAEEDILLDVAISAIHESDRERVSSAIQTALNYASGGKYDIEYTIVHPVSKEETIVRAKGRVSFNENHVAYRFNGTLEDITQRAGPIKKVAESEARYHNLIQSSPFAIGILDGEDLVVSVANQAIIDIWGKGWEIVGKSYFVALPELAEQGYEVVFSGVYKTGVPFNAVETPVHIVQDGAMTLKYYNFLLFPQKNIEGVIDGIGIIATEVTSHALLNKQVRESEQRFAAAVQAVEGIVWTNNDNGEMSGEQPGWAALTGQSYDEYQGAGWTNAIHPDDVKPTIDAWQEAVGEAKVFNFEHRLKTKEGDWRSFSIKAIPLKNEDGSLREWVVAHTDIQRQKDFTVELERQVKERTKELMSLNEALGKMNEELQSFAYISSHDLQEPLRKIQTFATLVQTREGGNLSDSGKDYFRRMQEAAWRMQTLINDLLGYSRTTTTERKFEQTDLNIIVEQVKADLQEELAAKRAAIETSNLGEVNIIPFQFRQLLFNLISNSLKFSSPGRTPVIKITGHSGWGSEFGTSGLLPSQRYCNINIADNGIGFEPEFSSRIFELFQRLHAKSDYAGTGIGLAIVKKIIENHNGLISANGELGKGASFDIYLPDNIV